MMQSSDVRESWTQIGAIAGLLLLVAAFAWPVFENGFVYDDVDVIENGDVIHDPSELLNLFRNNTMYASPRRRGQDLMVDTYRPVTLVSFMWDSAISGRDPWAYHATNLSMHLMCTLLVFLLVRRLLGRTNWGFALLAATWFAFSPHASTAHIWINGRSDLFCTAFGLGGILVWRLALERRVSATRTLLFAVSFILFFAGLLSKESLLFTLPALVLWPEDAGEVHWPGRLRSLATFGLAGLCYLGARMAVLGGMRGHEGVEHLRTALSYFAPLELEALAGALWPRRLYLRFLGEELAALSVLELGFCAATLLLVAVFVWLLRRRFPLVAWGLFWFASCVAPVALIAGLLWPGFGRYLYLPSVGLAVALGSLAQRAADALPRWRPLLLFGALAYLAFLGIHLRGWIEDFHDQETLYTAAIMKNPDGAHGYGWLGLSYVTARPEDAIGPLTIAHQLAPDERRYATSLLDAFMRTQRFEAAQRLAEECTERYDSDAVVFHMYLLNSMQSNPQAAARHVLECLRKDPGSAECGRALEKMLTQHPSRKEYLQAVREILAEEHMVAVRAQTAPLVNSR